MLDLARLEIDRAHDRHIKGDKEARVYHLIRAVEWLIQELEGIGGQDMRETPPWMEDNRAKL